MKLKFLDEVCTRMATHQPSTNDLLRVYTIEQAPSNNSQVIVNNDRSSSCANCSCRQNESNLINNNTPLPESEENQESVDPTLPSYSQVLSKTPPNFYTIPN
jgi:hypothetical protein